LPDTAVTASPSSAVTATAITAQRFSQSRSADFDVRRDTSGVKWGLILLALLGLGVAIAATAEGMTVHGRRLQGTLFLTGFIASAFSLILVGALLARNLLIWDTLLIVLAVLFSLVAFFIFACAGCGALMLS
jgi:hypothetical protein